MWFIARQADKRRLPDLSAYLRFESDQ
ncbi:hypothetical protein EE612_005315 [Oryza sativa]|nr:hypothetical protein EE612_005315 [Oryza sativa]